jgi:hypothetical protein
MNNKFINLLENSQNSDKNPKSGTQKDLLLIILFILDS